LTALKEETVADIIKSNAFNEQFTGRHAAVAPVQRCGPAQRAAPLLATARVMNAAQAFIIEEFVAVARNTLVGFARVRTPSGLVFHEVAVHKRDSACWASPASKPQLNRDGVQLKGPDGKGLWVPIVSFATRELRDRFSHLVINALRASHPDALNDA
jgi:hypothetical protein